MPLRNQFNTEGEWLEHLRIYFAAKAMQGLLASSVSAPMDTFAQHAYEMADAMLKAREVRS